jgi:hypothetical protein
MTQIGPPSELPDTVNPAQRASSAADALPDSSPGTPAGTPPRSWSWAGRGWTGRSLVDGWQRLPGWAQAVLIYGLSRLADVVIIGRTARFQAASLWNPPNPGYFDMVSLWDGAWYRRVAETGYPHSLPIDVYGHVAQSEWAFYPLYPFSVRSIMDLLGTSWPVTASMLAMLYGALAVVVLRSLIDWQAGRDLALWTVALLSFFPSAPVLQLAYTESLGLLLLFGALWCLQRHRYLLAVPIVVLIGFERPIGVPVAAVIGLHVLTRLLRHRREPVTWGSLVSMLVLVAAAAVAAVEWTVVAGLVTGTPDAYTQTMAAWRSGHTITLLRPWYWMSQYFFGQWFGPALLVACVATLAWVLTRPVARVIAGDLRAWVVCYAAYLAVVLDPYTSVVRYLLLLFPLGTVFAAASPSKAYRRTLVIAFLAGQILWVGWLWRFTPPSDWPP